MSAAFILTVDLPPEVLDAVAEEVAEAIAAMLLIRHTPDVSEANSEALRAESPLSCSASEHGRWRSGTSRCSRPGRSKGAQPLQLRP
jgi:hypothetical protein